MLLEPPCVARLPSQSTAASKNVSGYLDLLYPENRRKSNCQQCGDLQVLGLFAEVPSCLYTA